MNTHTKELCLKAVAALTVFCFAMLAAETNLGQEKILEKIKPEEAEKITEHITELQKLLLVPGPVDPSLHSNGCGPSWLPGFYMLINVQKFKGKDSVSKQKVTFDVNFKPACDLHDAGYSGLYVINRFGQGSNANVDYSTWSKAAIDRKFFSDLSKICDITIPATNENARDKCKGWGLGAKAYYQAVKRAGRATFDCNISIGGPPWTKPCTRLYD
jgi:hypothetical protein